MKRPVIFSLLLGFAIPAFSAEIRNIRCEEAHNGFKHVFTISGIDLKGTHSVGKMVKVGFYRYDLGRAEITYLETFDVPVSGFSSDRYLLDFGKVFKFPGHSSGDLDLAFREYYETGVTLVASSLAYVDDISSFARGGFKGGSVYRCKINFIH